MILSKAFSTLPWLRRSVSGLSPRWPNFNPKSFHVRFVVDKAALGQFLSPSTSVFPCQYHIANAPYSFNRLSLTLYNLSSLWCHYITHLKKKRFLL